MKGPGKRWQLGTTTVEFAIVGSVVFLVMFAVMEAGRLLYTWGVLNEASRRAARLATVCPVNEALDGTIAGMVSTQLGGVLPGFVPENVSFEYLGTTGTLLAAPLGADYNSIRYVRSRITNYQYEMILPLSVDLSMLAPDFSSTLRAESLGMTKAGEISCSIGGA
ncbi:TadE family protein [Zobellella denitrificans]|nr:TadE family protein [Zobellella denitrificans]